MVVSKDINSDVVLYQECQSTFEGLMHKHDVVEETMDTWMGSGTMLKIHHVNLQIPAFDKFNVYSVREGPLENWV
jgi:hypothetical protein